MRNCLVVCHGYFGDHFFALSIAKRLIREKKFDEVDYVVGWEQVLPFFKRDAYVNNIFYTNQTPSPAFQGDTSQYTAVYQLGPVHRVDPPMVEMQRACGVKRTEASFTLKTDTAGTDRIRAKFTNIRRDTKLPVIAIMNNWAPRTFLFTKEQYDIGIDVPYFGYGGAHRDTNNIVKAIESEFPVVMVGAAANVNQFHTITQDSLDYTASVIAASNFFIGAEGGLANLAFGVNTHTILTSDFVHQLYGPNGSQQKLERPMLGPSHYKTQLKSHIDLDPYLTDAEVVQHTIQHIRDIWTTE